MNLFGLTAYAQSTQPQPVEGGVAGLMTGTVIPLVLLIVVFYFMLIRPQRKRDKETRAMLEALKVGDKVVTIGGICGKITKIKDEFVFIETGNIGTQEEKSLLKMQRGAIKSVEKKISE